MAEHEEQPSADLQQARKLFDLCGAACAAHGLDQPTVAKALLVAAIDTYGRYQGLENVGGWLRVVAKVYERNYPPERPAGVTVQ